MEEETKGEQPKSIVEEAREVRDELIKIREEIKQERELLEKARAEAILSGRAEAGVQKQEEKKEETPLEYKNRVMRGEI